MTATLICLFAIPTSLFLLAGIVRVVRKKPTFSFPDWKKEYNWALGAVAALVIIAIAATYRVAIVGAISGPPDAKTRLMLIVFLVTTALFIGAVTWAWKRKNAGAIIGAPIILVLGSWLFAHIANYQPSPPPPALAIASGGPTKATGDPGPPTETRVFRAPVEWSLFQKVIKSNYSANTKVSGEIEIETASGKSWKTKPGSEGTFLEAKTAADRMWKFRSLTGKEETVTFSYWPD